MFVRSSQIKRCASSLNRIKIGLQCSLNHSNKNSLRSYSQSSSREAEKETIIKLLENISSRREAELYLNHFNTTTAPKFAIVKVGGAVLTDYIDTLASSLIFLQRAGLFPIVVHGAGPQLNKLLDEAGIEPQYHEGIRITDGATLELVRRVFQEENLKLVEALEKRGARARPINGGVFIAEPLNTAKYGFVGQIVEVNRKMIDSSIEAGALPILTSLAETKEGQILNVNADIAASMLARSIEPLKVVYLNEKDGIMHGETGKKIDLIDLDQDYEELSRQPWFRYGTKLKINQIKELLESLPQSSSVSVISPQHLQKELFTSSGAGTLIRRGYRVFSKKGLNEVDLIRLKELIKKTTSVDVEPYLHITSSESIQVYHDSSYSVAAIMTKDTESSLKAPYMTCFAASDVAELQGLTDMIWNQIRKEQSSLIWRVPRSDKNLSWHFERSDGSFNQGDSTLFWFGLGDNNQAIDIIQKLDTIQVPGSKFSNSPIRQQQSCFSTLANSYKKIQSFKGPQKRSFATTSDPLRIGLIGARGHTGQELVQLVDNHPQFKLTHISSRELAGTVLKSYRSSTITYEQISAKDIAQVNDVDAWILALPNNIAKPFVDSLDESAKTTRDRVILDLSADYRFDTTGRWYYGLPELYPLKEQGSRDKPAALRISNPGCYATGCQVGVKPLVDLFNPPSPPTIFGLSGFSGAGTTPSPKNDPEVLRDNMIPYALSGHIHEREVGHHIGTKVFFSPHVAAFFRGITLTISVALPPSEKHTSESLFNYYSDYYKGQDLIRVRKDIPLVRDNQNGHGVRVGGFTVSKDQSRVVLVVTLDNLLKGAATQAIQNLNLSFGLSGLTGIPEFK